MSEPHNAEIETGPSRKTVTILTIAVIVLSAALVYNIQTTDSKINSLNQDLKNTAGLTLAIWNTCNNKAHAGCSVGEVLYWQETVPDAFAYNDVWSSTTPIMVYYLTLAQFVQFSTCTTGINIGCVTGSYSSVGPTMQSNDTFTLAEGCGGYIAVYTATQTGLIYPNVSITYKPASVATGTCAP